jgi:hypothetical protein
MSYQPENSLAVKHAQLARKNASADAYGALGYIGARAALGAGVGYLGSNIAEQISPSKTEEDRRRYIRQNTIIHGGIGAGVGTIKLLLERARENRVAQNQNVKMADLSLDNPYVANTLGALARAGLGAGAGLGAYTVSEAIEPTEDVDERRFRRRVMMASGGLVGLGSSAGKILANKLRTDPTDKVASAATMALGRVAKSAPTASSLYGLGDIAGKIHPSLLAGAGGWLLAPAAADAAGIESDAGRLAQRIATTGVAAAFGNPKFLRALWTKNTLNKDMAKLLKTNPEAANFSLNQIRKVSPTFGSKASPVRGTMLTAGLVSLPTSVGAYTDPMKAVSQKFMQDIEKNPEMATPGYWFDKAVDKGVDKALNSDQFKDVSTIGYEMAKSMGSSMAGSVGGTALGYGAGSLLGRMVMPIDNADINNLNEEEYQARRSKERARMLINFLGLHAGAVGGAMLGQKYLPGIIDGSISRKDLPTMPNIMEMIKSNVKPGVAPTSAPAVAQTAAAPLPQPKVAKDKTLLDDALVDSLEHVGGSFAAAVGAGAWQRYKKQKTKKSPAPNQSVEK